ncbi:MULTISPECIES: hypothetical protein [Calothrix]|uniref:Uncharacterized protein n=2 Tax=Calothrix TaxID=1186 RepID=A0ABR8A1U9_9CYAN|nr:MULTISPECIES: hypothetical protein [Calothrix]MBD2193926.1 hypothetical protein [Calothrix parietina FACHB-288]MBD2222933.1 hypothetical protein [Calothrix anomala FACHB-343]
MDSSERRARIRANLGIEPISHGQVYTFQIAIPESEKENISLERSQLIEDTLIQHKSNLIPLIVRRTDKYSEEEEYEVIYGADWCIVAKQLDIEKLWVWVFDMNDEQAVAVQEEMQQLLGSSSNREKPINQETDVATLLESKLKPIYTKLNQLLSDTTANVSKSDLEQKIITIESQVKNLSFAIERLAVSLQELMPRPKLNLLTANEEDIKNALDETGANKNQRNAALKALQYWKQPGKTLSWENLRESAASGSEYKIKNFAYGTYEKLRKVSEIRSK